jgi:L-ascorbate metabolism protein UlaG (beta-lactamase superfamily)
MPLSMKDNYEYNNKVIYVEPNNTYEIDDIVFNTIPMYNINKNFHKKEYNWCGYNINIDGKWIYFIGDSDNIEEMNDISCDIVFIPIGGIYTMDFKEAIECLKNINYSYVIPYHYGSVVGDISLGDEFKNKIGNKCILKIKKV